MELQIRAKNLELTQVIRDYITRKMKRINRHLPVATGVAVELTSEHTRPRDQRVVAQITLDIDGVVLRGEERGLNVMAVVDSAIDVMARRISRYKGKSYRSQQAKRVARRGPSRLLQPPGLSDAYAPSEAEGAEGPERVVRVKQFPVKPMAVDEAMFQMELLGHDFFLFLNTDAGTYNVLYRRHDGAYGLLQPEFL